MRLHFVRKENLLQTVNLNQVVTLSTHLCSLFEFVMRIFKYPTSFKVRASRSGYRGPCFTTVTCASVQLKVIKCCADWLTQLESACDPVQFFAEHPEQERFV